MSWSIHNAVSAAAQLARRARTGAPGEDNAPRRRGRGPRVLDGQIDIYGIEHRKRRQPAPWEEAEPDERD
jgi:hypothetical protein